MSSMMNQMEVVILDDKMPRSLTMLVKLPGGRVRSITAHWDIAASQFIPAVQNGLDTLVKELIDRHNVRPRRSKP